MFKHLLTSLFLSFILAAPLSAQSTVESSITGLQFNLNNVAVFHERALSNQATLRFQANFGLHLEGRTIGDNVDFDLFLQPTLRVEPRYYYNLAKREAKGKRTSNNGGNFISLKTEYQLPFTLASTDADRRLRGRLSFIPRWGIRRDLGSGWDFELGLGAGVRIANYQLGSSRRTDINRALDVEWKFGFRF